MQFNLLVRAPGDDATLLLGWLPEAGKSSGPMVEAEVPILPWQALEKGY